MRDLPGPGMEPVCPAFAGGFFMTEPPGKAPMWTIFKVFIEFVPVLILLYVLLFLALWHVGSCLPERGLNPHPLQPCSGKRSLSNWTRRKVPQYTLPLSMRLRLFISVVSVQCKCFGQCMPLCLPAPHKGSQAGSLKPIMVGSIHTMKLASATNGPPPLQIVVEHLPA